MLDELSSLDNFFLKNIAIPVSTFLFRVTGIGTARIGAGFILLGYVLGFDNGWLNYIFLPIGVALLLLLWYPLARRLEESTGEGSNTLPFGYDSLVLLRRWHTLTMPLFVVMNGLQIVVTGISVEKLLDSSTSVLFYLGYAILSIGWPRRKSWVREKIENLKETRHEKLAVIPVSRSMG